MTKEKIEAVKIEMKRLVTRINELEAAKRVDTYSNNPTYPRETGALRRASMDLTRALSDLRR